LRVSWACLVLGLGACKADAPRQPRSLSGTECAAEERAIGAVLDDWHAAAAAADEARYFSHFSRAAVFLGTDATERWDVESFRRYAHPRFATGKAWTFRSVQRFTQVAPNGNVAWFDEALVTERLGPARGSGVLVREVTGWQIALYDLSIPIPNERFDEVRKLLAR
jgi:hypothetical protein